MNGDAAHHADQEGRDHHAPEAAEPADHHHHEGHRDDLGAHGRMHDRDRSKECTPECGHAHAEHDDRGHVGLQPDAECCDHVRPLNAGAHDAPERGLVQQEPDAEQDCGDHDQNEQAVA
jgi:hypothetical protein